MDEQEQPILDRQWVREAPVHELSAHGRELQARWRAGTEGPRRPSVLKRLRFRLWLLLRR